MSAEDAAAGMLQVARTLKSSGDSQDDTLDTYVASTLAGGNYGTGQREADFQIGSAVRRLTPVECERLQGLPDDWTRIPDDAPDSRRYAALGDAVTVPVAEWIGRRLVSYMETAPEGAVSVDRG